MRFFTRLLLKILILLLSPVIVGIYVVILGVTLYYAFIVLTIQGENLTWEWWKIPYRNEEY